MSVMALNSSRQTEMLETFFRQNNPQQPPPITIIPKTQEAMRSQPAKTMLAGPIKGVIK